tara:strand:+ start:572 stop:976 length:405 start_codon:yes stop_codon:yes gene_type:complete
MNPIVATGILSASKNIIDKFSISNQTKLQEPQDVKFDIELRKAESEKSTSIKSIRSDFLECDKVHEFLKSDTGTQIHLESRADGSIKLVSSSGRFLVLDAGTESCKLGKELLSASLEQKVNLSSSRTNAILIRG